VTESGPYYTSTVLSNVAKLAIVLCLLIVLVAAVLLIVRIRNPAYFRSKILNKSDNPETVSDQDVNRDMDAFYYYYDLPFDDDVDGGRSPPEKSKEKEDGLLSQLASLPSVF